LVTWLLKSEPALKTRSLSEKEREREMTMMNSNLTISCTQVALVLLMTAGCQTSAPRGMSDGGSGEAAMTDSSSSPDSMAPSGDADANGPCESNFDCTGGAMCVDGRCQMSGGPECVSYFDCPEGQVCIEGRCGERMAPTDPPMMGGSCCDGVLCEGDLYCDEACECSDPSVCDPPCADPLVCDYGFCTHPCTFDGCEGDLLCTEEGCREPRCTYEDCTTRSPPLACDPYELGCYDPCSDPLISSGCEALGAVCELGSCVDASCIAVGAGCGYVADCCGTFFCQADTEPAPECPETCGEAEDAPPDGFCACEVMGFCTDHRWSTGYMSGGGELPPPGSSDGGVPLPAP
jgi:hypothetical protein